MKQGRDKMLGLKQIGRGLFTKCYKLNDHKVLLKSSDPVKEVMALGWFPDSELFPKVSFSEEHENCYEMEYYPKVRSLKSNLDPDQYRLYKELRLIAADFIRPKRECDRYQAWYDAFEKSDLDSATKEALQDALDAIGYSDVQFEISPRNVAVDCGKLVLLDCFFITSEAAKIRKRSLVGY